MTSPGKPLLSTGDALQLAEADYRYGRGQLRLRVTEAVPDTSAEWVQVTGVELRRDGSDSQPRTVMVRVAALRRHRPGR